MKKTVMLVSFIILLTLFGCSKEKEEENNNENVSSSVENYNNYMDNDISNDLDFVEDVKNFIYYNKKLSAIQSLASANQNTFDLCVGAIEQTEDIEDMVKKYNNVEGHVQYVTFKEILTEYKAGLDLVTQGHIRKEPLYILDGYEKFINVNSSILSLCKSLDIPLEIGVQKTKTVNNRVSEELYQNPLDEKNLRERLESEFGKDIFIDNISYQKFSLVAQSEVNNTNFISIEVIIPDVTEGTEYTYTELLSEMESILSIVFNNSDVEEVSVTFLMKYDGKIKPAYAVRFPRDRFSTTSFEANGFSGIIDMHGHSFIN